MIIMKILWEVQGIFMINISYASTLIDGAFYVSSYVWRKDLEQTLQASNTMPPITSTWFYLHDVATP